MKTKEKIYPVLYYNALTSGGPLNFDLSTMPDNTKTKTRNFSTNVAPYFEQPNLKVILRPFHKSISRMKS